MSNATTDLPAFPIPGPLFAIGLTKRELFAAMASGDTVEMLAAYSDLKGYHT